MRSRLIALGAIACAVVLVCPSAARAQGRHCAILCAPSVAGIPGVTISNVMNAPSVQPLSGGPAHNLKSKSNLQLGLAATAPTQWQRLALFAWVTWLPTATRPNNPFTQYTAAETGDTIRASHVNLALGAKLHLLPSRSTGGVLGIDGDIYDSYTPAARPKDTSSYTHKLALQGDALVGIFNWTRPGNWLRNVPLYVSLTYAATGLPRSGDVVPAGVRRFTSDAHPFSLTTGLSLPLAPLIPKK